MTLAKQIELARVKLLEGESDLAAILDGAAIQSEVFVELTDAQKRLTLALAFVSRALLAAKHAEPTRTASSCVEPPQENE